MKHLHIAGDNVFILHFLSKGNKHKGIHHNWDNKNRQWEPLHPRALPSCTAVLLEVEQGSPVMLASFPTFNNLNTVK